METAAARGGSQPLRRASVDAVETRNKSVLSTGGRRWQHPPPLRFIPDVGSPGVYAVCV